MFQPEGSRHVFHLHLSHRFLRFELLSPFPIQQKRKKNLRYFFFPLCCNKKNKKKNNNTAFIVLKRRVEYNANLNNGCVELAILQGGKL